MPKLNKGEKKGSFLKRYMKDSDYSKGKSSAKRLSDAHASYSKQRKRKSRKTSSSAY